MYKLIQICYIILIWIKSSQLTEFFDLTYTLDESNLFYPGQRFDYKLYKDIQGYNYTIPEHMRYWFAMYSFCMGEHGGTHIDAPFHFNENGWRMGEIPLNRLADIAAVVIDVEKDVFSLEDPRLFQLQVNHILEHERKYGKIPLEAVILVHTGWGRYWPDKEKFMGLENGTMHFPGLSINAANWLVENRKLVGVGIDTQSAEVGNWKDLEGAPRVHLILTKRQVYIIENVAYLSDLLRKIRPQAGSSVTAATTGTSAGSSGPCDLRIFVMPIKSIGTGGPTRVVAYCK